MMRTTSSLGDTLTIELNIESIKLTSVDKNTGRNKTGTSSIDRTVIAYNDCLLIVSRLGRVEGGEVMMMVIMGRICLYIDTLSSHTITGILSRSQNYQWKLL